MHRVAGHFLSGQLRMRHNPDMRELYRCPIGAGKAHKVTVTRKLIVIPDSLPRDRRTWIPDAPIRYLERHDRAHAAVGSKRTTTCAVCG